MIKEDISLLEAHKKLLLVKKEWPSTSFILLKQNNNQLHGLPKLDPFLEE